MKKIVFNTKIEKELNNGRKLTLYHKTTIEANKNYLLKDKEGLESIHSETGLQYLNHILKNSSGKAN